MPATTYKLVIRDQLYTVHTTVQSTLLLLQCTAITSQLTWSAKFTTQYIEDMSSKTGVHQPYNKFISLLTDALQRTAAGSVTESSELLLDILTVDDLQQIKRQKQGLNDTTNLNTTQSTNNSKRYLILTVQYDNQPVHYPLPLKLTNNNDIQHTHNALSAHTLPVKSSDNTLISSASPCQPDKCIHALKLSTVQREHSKVVVELEIARSELNALQQTSRSASIQSGTHHKRGSKLPDQQVVDQLESHVWELQEYINQLNAKHQKQVNQLNHDIDTLQLKLKKANESERDYRIKCRKLESDIKQLSSHTSNSSYYRATSNSRTHSADARQQQRGRSRPISRSSSVASVRAGTSMSRSSSVSSVRNVVNRLYPGGSSIRSRNSSPAPSSKSSYHYRSTSAQRTRSASPALNTSSRSMRSNSSIASFDATAYIRAKQERERTVAERRQAERVPPRVTPVREPSRTRVDRDGNIVAVRRRDIDTPSNGSRIEVHDSQATPYRTGSTVQYGDQRSNFISTTLPARSSTSKYIEAQKHSAETQQEIDNLLNKLSVDTDSAHIPSHQPRRVTEINDRLASLQSKLEQEKQALRADC